MPIILFTHIFKVINYEIKISDFSNGVPPVGLLFYNLIFAIK